MAGRAEQAMSTDVEVTSPFIAAGGADGVAALVNRFYDLMETDPAYAELRALHAADLAPMRASLTGFLSGWLGGPRDWFDANPGRCMMSMHANVPVSALTARQWTAAMGRALADTGVEPDLAARILDAFTRMAAAMAR
jgi:hemoglobin